jgi:hypothetical protein
MTSTTARAAAALSLFAAVLTACGGSSHLTREEAAQHAMDALAREVRTPGSGLYHHQIAILSVAPRGKGGWLVRIGDRTDGSVICVVDLPEHGAFGTRENLRGVLCAPPSPTTTTTTSPGAA